MFENSTLMRRRRRSTGWFSFAEEHGPELIDLQRIMGRILARHDTTGHLCFGSFGLFLL